MVILEALAARKPVIATRVGAVPDVIRDGGTGLLIEPGDPVELQRAIKRLIEDAGLRRSLAENGHERVKAHFSAASMAGNYQRVYESALRG
jgi:glycosyltransferase involved in cell wall biosynthesis